MSIITVDRHEWLHTCPGDPLNPHPIVTAQRVVHTVPGGPCRAPVTVRINGTSGLIPCGDRRRSDEQCSACRRIIVIREVSYTDLGYQHPEPINPAATGYAPTPCTVCGDKLAAVLAATGRHLLCIPRPIGGRAL